MKRKNVPLKATPPKRPSRRALAPAKPRGLKRKSDVPPERIQMYLRSRFNPLRILTPAIAGWYIDQFRIGYVRQLSLVWQEIADRDDVVALVKPLREQAISRYEGQIEPIPHLDESLLDEAADQQEKMEYFFANLTASNAVDGDHVGGDHLLTEQMMGAVGAKYSVHEIIWQPQADGNLTAELRWTPLWFFERTIGRLRYMQLEGDALGVDLDEDGWMITVGQGLMIATMIAYLFKKMPLGDWVTFCERNGMPAAIGTSDASPGSTEWNALGEALKHLSSDLAIVKSSSDKIDILDLKGSQAALPYEPLVKRMDARIASLWRGGDLSTQSSGAHAQGRGSNRQEDEAEIILDHDVRMVDDARNIKLIRPAIRYLYGPDAIPLVRYTTVVPPKEATAQDIAVDEFLLGAGAQLSVEDAMRRYGRVAAQPGETLLTPPQQDEVLPTGLGNETSGGPEFVARLVRQAHRQLLPKEAAAMKPVRERFRRALEAPDAELHGRVHHFLDQLPSMLRTLNVRPATARLIEITYTSALLDGLKHHAHEN